MSDPDDDYPSLFGDTVHDFYENAPLDRGYPVRIDLLLLFNPTRLEPAPKTDPLAIGVDAHLQKYLYRFMDRVNKKDALLGILKLLR